MAGKKRPLVVITRKLPDPVETRMRELFDTRLNLDDKPMKPAQIAEAMRTADVLVPTVTDRIDAAVLLLPPDNRLSQSGTKLTALSLEAAGVPVLSIDADMVDARNWQHDRMVALVADFLEQRGLT